MEKYLLLVVIASAVALALWGVAGSLVRPFLPSAWQLGAHFVFVDPYVSINAVNLSAHVRQVTLRYASELQDDTAGGDNTRNRLGGLKDWSIDVEFAQDYAAGAVDASLFAIVGTSVAIEVRPDTEAVSATNPKYTGNAIIESYQPMGGQIGALAMAPVTLQGNGDLTRATA